MVQCDSTSFRTRCYLEKNLASLLKMKKCLFSPTKIKKSLNMRSTQKSIDSVINNLLGEKLLKLKARISTLVNAFFYKHSLWFVPAKTHGETRHCCRFVKVTAACQSFLFDACKLLSSRQADWPNASSIFIANDSRNSLLLFLLDFVRLRRRRRTGSL